MKHKLVIFLIYIFPICLLMKIDVVSSAVRNNLTRTSNLGTDVSNQMWNQAIHSNNRGGSSNGADVNYKNCYALAQRCAKPKCKAGCNDLSLASSVVSGCINGLENCSEYTDGIIESLSAELVATANAKQEVQSGSNNDEQLIELQNQMQQLSAQTQQVIAEANARAEAAERASVSQNDSAIVNTESANVSTSNTSDELRARATLSGQIFTKLDDIQTGLAKTKKVLSAFYTYAGCNTSGENCKAPKRVSAMKEKAELFLDAYDETRLAVYNALLAAQTAGVDIDDIYRLLSDSCEQWGIYKVKTDAAGNEDDEEKELYKLLTKTEEEYEDDLLNPGRYTESLSCYTNGQGCGFKMKVECVSKNIAKSNSFFKGLSVGSQDILSIDTLRDILSADYIPTKQDSENGTIETKVATQCGGNSDALTKFLSSKTNNLHNLVSTKDCYGNTKIESIKCTDENINPNLAICSTHVYNIGETTNESKKNTENQEGVEEILELKTQVLARELQRQYRYLESTVNRFQVQVEKAVAKVDENNSSDLADSSSSFGSSSVEKFDEKSITECRGSIDDKISCYYSNLSTIHNSLNGAKTISKVQKALEKQCNLISSLVDGKDGDLKSTCSKQCKDKQQVSECFTAIDNALANYEDERKNNKKQQDQGIKAPQQ